ncbi:MAG: hypothetical protein D6679_04065 [Candidatus Hydrogenedentota bacterium]|nr:MAG: hypothetical protein D6679_04065 [Candidatus Hydrogenedentota bacterium]
MESRKGEVVTFETPKRSDPGFGGERRPWRRRESCREEKRIQQVKSRSAVKVEKAGEARRGGVWIRTRRVAVFVVPVLLLFFSLFLFGSSPAYAAGTPFVHNDGAYSIQIEQSIPAEEAVTGVRFWKVSLFSNSASEGVVRLWTARLWWPWAPMAMAVSRRGSFVAIADRKRPRNIDPTILVIRDKTGGLRFRYCLSEILGSETFHTGTGRRVEGSGWLGGKMEFTRDEKRLRVPTIMGARFVDLKDGSVTDETGKIMSRRYRIQTEEDLKNTIRLIREKRRLVARVGGGGIFGRQPSDTDRKALNAVEEDLEELVERLCGRENLNPMRWTEARLSELAKEAAASFDSALFERIQIAEERMTSDITKRRLEKISVALDEFERKQDRYPDENEGLEVLTIGYGRGATLAPGDLLDGWGRPFYYRPYPRGVLRYTLLSVGPDGVRGTEDDLLPPERTEGTRFGTDFFGY